MCVATEYHANWIACTCALMLQSHLKCAARIYVQPLNDTKCVVHNYQNEQPLSHTQWGVPVHMSCYKATQKGLLVRACSHWDAHRMRCPTFKCSRHATKPFKFCHSCTRARASLSRFGSSLPCVDMRLTSHQARNFIYKLKLACMHSPASCLTHSLAYVQLTCSCKHDHVLKPSRSVIWMFGLSHQQS